jgi:hypothetical protein
MDRQIFDDTFWSSLNENENGKQSKRENRNIEMKDIFISILNPIRESTHHTFLFLFISVYFMKSRYDNLYVRIERKKKRNLISKNKSSVYINKFFF